MWNPGDVVAWRGIFRGRIWHVQPTIVVKDSPEEIVLALLPGTECIAEENYLTRKDKSKRHYFREKNWQLAKYVWRTNRVLAVIEPEKFYAIMLFWDHNCNEFIGYYVNFQLPFKRNPYGIDTLDLDLDLDIEPDLTFRWKDEDDYQKAINHGLISPEWIQGIHDSKPEIFDKLKSRVYPFDGSWLDWMPDPKWEPPQLPENWDKV
jgi:predicted RNA-binding protein associated with RNAse of E/G family